MAVLHLLNDVPASPRQRSRRCRRDALLGLIACAAAAAACAGAAPGRAAPDDLMRVVFVSDTAQSSLPEEESAAFAWLRAQPGTEIRQVQLVDLAGARLEPREVLWWHYAASRELPSAAMAPSTLDAVRDHVRAGGAVLLTLFASTWVVPLGFESRGPDQIDWVDGTDFARWGPDDDRILAGFQSYRGHPLLRRFWGGTYTATLSKGRRYAVARYTGERWPSEGKVVAVAKRYIGIDTSQRVILEYRPSPQRRGTVLSIGQGIYFADSTNRNRLHLELFTGDALRHVAGIEPPAPLGAAVASTGASALPSASTMAADEATAPAPPGTPGADTVEPGPTLELPEILEATTFWGPASTEIRFFEPTPATLPEIEDDPTLLEAVSAARSGLALETEGVDDAPFDLFSPTVLLTGRQTGVIEDLWIWPVRVLRDLRLGLRAGDGTVTWLDTADDGGFVARPEGDSWQYRLGDRVVSVHLSVARQSGGALLLIDLESPRRETLVARWTVDHAVSWPREEGHLGVLEIGWEPETGAVVWRDAQGRFAAWAGFGRPDALVQLSSGTAPESAPDGGVTLAIEHDPASATPIIFAVGADATEPDAARDTYLSILADPVAVWASNANYYREFLDDTLDLATPDPTFNDALRWAKVGLDAFRATTPGLGTGLMAGYATSADREVDTWSVDNDFLRRPGYGWYFGRDAVWTAFAADAYGGTDLTAEALRFLARYQDVDGKILHEMSPSWAIHYDAADSTPLFLIGLEHHIRATGDRDLLRDLWPSVRRAMAFLETTDTDGDGLIENTAVGHGWIEGGKFYGAHTTLYLAGLWAATLDAVGNLASWIGDAELADDAEARALAVREILDAAFWDDAGRSWYHGKRADGTFMAIRTIMPSVPMYLGLLEETKSRPLLDLFASAQITADWGSRMVERSNPDYDPRGYHDGMVWPLFSGWTALAGYRHHRPLGAWANLIANIRLYRHDNLGYMPETLDGDRFESAGVTSHQSWSEAMVLLPAIEGLLGIRVDAMNGRLRVHPHLPGGWNEVVANYVRVGEDAFRVRITRGAENSGFEIERVAGSSPVQLELSLPFPRSVLVNLDRDATVGVVLLEGETIIDHPGEKEASVIATLTEPSARVVFRHSRFAEVIPPVPTLEPGARSSGLRLVDTTFRDGALQVRVEGIPGRRYRLNLNTPWPLVRAAGRLETTIVAPGPGRATVELVVPGTVVGYQRAEVILEFQR